MATLDEVHAALAAHDRIVKDQYEHLEQGIEEIKAATGSEGNNMNTTNDNSINGMLLAALLGNNNNGYFGNRHNSNDSEGIVTPSQFQSGINSVNTATENLAIMQGIADIKAAVPLAEGQVQLALAGAVAQLNGAISATTNAVLASEATVNKNISDAVAAVLASQNNINVNVLQSANNVKEAVTTFGVANLQATKDSQYATALAIAGSTKEILEALNAQNVANLQRQLTVAESALADRTALSRSRDIEVNVTQQVTQTQNQLQAQNQQQQQFQLLAQLTANMHNLANDIQSVKQGSVIFNSGRMAESGNQSAANTRVA